LTFKELIKKNLKNGIIKSNGYVKGFRCIVHGERYFKSIFHKFVFICMLFSLIPLQSE